MTKTLPNHEVRFYGHSDDCFEIDGAVRDEVNEGVFCIEDPAGQRINLVASWSWHSTGMWMLGLQAIEDDDQWPTWNMRWSKPQEESPTLAIDLPEGTTITRVYPKPERCDECKRDKDPERWTVGK